MSTIAPYSPLNITEGLVPNEHQWEMAYGESNGQVADDVT